MTAPNKIYAGSDSRKPLPDQCTAPDCQRPPRTRLNNIPLCGKHEQRYRRYGAFDLPKRETKPWKTCSVDGCSRDSRTRLGALCEVHYYRRYRTGTFDDPTYKRRYKTHGYIRLVGVDCDIAGENGSILEHRKVLYDAIGSGEHQCNWCGTPVRWAKTPLGRGALVVDHVNNKKDDNRVENLVPSCQPCNATRGLFMAWVMKHKDDPFLAELFAEALADS